MTTNTIDRRAITDQEFTDYTVKSYDEQGNLSLNLGGIYLDPKLTTEENKPKPGETVRFFGRGLGYVVRGIGKLDALGNLAVLYRYETAVEEMQSHARRVQSDNEKKQAQWAVDAEKNARRIAAMPDAFKKRVEFFMRLPDWGWRFGQYELFVCEEAIKILAVAATVGESAKWIDNFRQSSGENQNQLIPELAYEEHSGNTFNAACGLARLYITDPMLVPMMHGALCPLVGCQDYGCYSTTVEAKEEEK